VIRQAVPEDKALPQLGRLLDAEAMAPVLGRMLDGSSAPDAIRVSYVRYRPGRRLLVSYEVQAGSGVYQAVGVAEPAACLGANAIEPGNVKLAKKVAERFPVRKPLAYEPELDALFLWSPLDLKLPALVETPERLRRELVQAGLELEDDDLPRLVKHKPRNRAIMRLDGHVVKIYASEPSFVESLHATHKAASLPLRTARCEAIVPDLRMLAQTLVPGNVPDSGDALTAAAGTVLARLHGADVHGLPLEPAADQLDDAAGDAELAAMLVPSLGARTAELVRELERSLPDAGLVPSHGGYRRTQLLDGDGELGVIDFDGFCRSPAARDLSSFAASIVETPDDVPAAFETLDILTGAYGSRPTGLTWYLAAYLLRRTRRPFTRLEPDWPDAVEERLRAAELALELGS
jgi:hypothetical protein